MFIGKYLLFTIFLWEKNRGVSIKAITAEPGANRRMSNFD